MKSSKKDSKKGYKLLILMLCIIIAFCLYKIGGTLLEYYKGTEAYKDVQEDFQKDPKNDKKSSMDFAPLIEENDDIRAWLYSPDTPINYPVMQGEDNDYYLYRMFNEEWNSKGSLFIDYRCINPFDDFNTIIYGHRMKDGSMFHSLTKYRDKEFYENHKSMVLYTPEKDYKLEIFSVNTIPADSELYKIDFNSTEEKEDYLREVVQTSQVDMNVKVSAKDKIVMMSTCTYEFENARLVVYGRLAEMEN